VTGGWRLLAYLKHPLVGLALVFPDGRGVHRVSLPYMSWQHSGRRQAMHMHRLPPPSMFIEKTTLRALFFNWLFFSGTIVYTYCPCQVPIKWESPGITPWTLESSCHVFFNGRSHKKRNRKRAESLLRYRVGRTGSSHCPGAMWSILVFLWRTWHSVRFNTLRSRSLGNVVWAWGKIVAALSSPTS